MKFLFVDDSKDVLDRLRFELNDLSDLEFAQCRTVKAGLEAIRKYRPDVVFVDHYLDSNEFGLGIVNRVSETFHNPIFYSISGSIDDNKNEIAEEYEKLGIKWINKYNPKGLRLAISQLLFLREARDFIDRVGPCLGSLGDFTDQPEPVGSRTDVCMARRTAENGYSYGYDVIYVVWKDDKELKCREVANTRATQERIFIRKILEIKAGFMIELSTGQKFSFAFAELR